MRYTEIVLPKSQTRRFVTVLDAIVMYMDKYKLPHKKVRPVMDKAVNAINAKEYDNGYEILVAIYSWVRHKASAKIPVPIGYAFDMDGYGEVLVVIDSSSGKIANIACTSDAYEYLQSGDLPE